MTSESHSTATEPGEDFWALPREEAVAQLMREFNMSRKRAETLLDRQRTPRIWRDAVEAITQEEMDSLLEEIARSGQNMSIFGKKQSTDET